MIDSMQTLITRISQYVWENNLRSATGIKAVVIRSARIIQCVFRDITRDQLTLLAMSLVYTTLLSLVPLIALSFSVLKAFGVHNQIQPLLYNLVSAMGDKGTELIDRILGFVDNINAGALGVLGLTILLYTVVSMLQKIERAFNYIWKINRPRRFTQRFSDYLSVIFVGPVLLFTGIALAASVRNTDLVKYLQEIEPFGSLISFGSLLLPHLLIIFAFTFIYIFIPNTKVRPGSAFVGALVSGILWQSAGLAFATFIASSTTQTAIYSSFAILIFFIIWLYLGWMILLIGADVSFYYQNPLQMSRERQPRTINNHLRERLALLLMYHIGSNFYHNQPAWNIDTLSDRLGIAKDTLHEALKLLQKNHLITENADDTPGYLPARDIETIRLLDIIDTVRLYNSQPERINQQRLSTPAVDVTMQRLREAIETSLGNKTLRDMVLDQESNNGGTPA